MKKYKIYTSSNYRYTNEKALALKMAKDLLDFGLDVSISEIDVENDN